ncbi:uncharacterized protein LOC109708746 [Ananas comosus]|uniref:Uncharacterized protein LOC109708746 n=1 Tax=Ananas comosus TaxID=4615 RepID=A0A6P5EYD3_ANACO|nr:uncharacterized protein LOC109708746 [Ananas comosus]
MGQRCGKQHDQPIPKGREESKKAKQSSLHLFFFLSLFSTLCFFFAVRFLSTSSSSLSFFGDKEIAFYNNYTSHSWHRHSPCSFLSNNSSICCDRTSYHSDICFMSGDVRTHSHASSVVLYPPSNVTINRNSSAEEKIRPYPRKWEGIIMDRISELRLRAAAPQDAPHPCDVRHDVPAIFFSAGGYTGNVFHAFNDAILPLYITSHRLRRRVVLVVLNYHHWWFIKYREILAGISDYPPIDFSNNTRTHCFPGAVAGLRFHGTLAIDPAKLSDETMSMQTFQHMLEEAYNEPKETKPPRRPKLVVVSRGATRVVENEGEVVQLARAVGFDVEVLRPTDRMPMARVYASLSRCDAMMGVHGAALTHFLFMRPGATFIQVIPLGVKNVADTCYRDPAVRAGLRYAEYEVLPRESSLSRKYGADDVVVRDPERVQGKKAWDVTKQVYLEGQNVTLDIRRLRKTLARVFETVVADRRRLLNL